jgi:hypothetical protein
VPARPRSRGTAVGPPEPRPSSGRLVVWIVDAEHWPRACLRAELIERGYDAVGFETMGAVLLELALSRVVPPSLFIIDLAGQDVAGGQLAALAQTGRPVMGIAGAVEREQEAVRRFAWSALLARPVSLGVIAHVAERALAGPAR